MGLPPKAAASRGVKTKTSRVPTHRHDLGGHAGPHERSSVLRGASATASSMRRARGSVSARVVLVSAWALTKCTPKKGGFHQ